MPADRISKLQRRSCAGGSVRVEGWLRSARHGKERSFLDLNDGSCLSGIQVVVEPDLPNYEALVKTLKNGCAVSVFGELVTSPGKSQRYEILSKGIDIVGEVADDYPLQKKRHSFEFLRTIAHLRPRTNTLGSVWRVRNAATMAVHNFFQTRDFLYLHSPIITLSDAEGAGEMFRVTTLDAKRLLQEDGREDFSKDFFGDETHLTVSGQLEAEIGALAMHDVYTFGPTFRAENSNTSRHLAEFWMVEPEMAFCDLEEDIEVAKDFLKEVIQAVLSDCEEDLAFFNERIERNLLNSLRNAVNTQPVHMTYTDAIEVLKGKSKGFTFPVSWGADLQSEHERFLCEEYVKGPVVVTDYPKDIKAFYMYVNDDEKTVRAVDVLLPGIGEIIGGSQREHRHDVLSRRLMEAGLPLDRYKWYLDLRRFGGVPHSGFGLGFERLMLFLTGMSNIRDVIPFPRVPGYADF